MISTDHPLILGSSSPRRIEILKSFAFPFEQHSPNFDESSLTLQGNPDELIAHIAKKKAESLATVFSQRLILCADTLVVKEGIFYPKPKDIQEAFSFLKQLAGTFHEVKTALCLYANGKYHTKVATTRVHFCQATDKQLKSYITSLSCLDKAGAYMAQLPGSVMIEKIDGCFYNVVGLPIQALETLLNTQGYSLWDHLSTCF